MPGLHNYRWMLNPFIIGMLLPIPLFVAGWNESTQAFPDVKDHLSILLSLVEEWLIYGPIVGLILIAFVGSIRTGWWKIGPNRDDNNSKPTI